MRGPEAFTKARVSAFSSNFVPFDAFGPSPFTADSHRALYPCDKLESAVSMRITSKGIRGTHASRALSRSQS